MISIRDGRDIRLHRMAVGVELKCFAKMLGMSSGTLRDFELGRVPVHQDTLELVGQTIESIRSKGIQKPQAAA